ncbi:MAG TPA: MarR family transcriptional regulator [Candidatus Dormibacteraeota bacterium]|nr:MarR family transcriptional regulator [Candidatus Dormibacteraeota bacterium]
MLSNRNARPARTAAGDAFTQLVLEVVGLATLFTAAGESLAEVGDQTLARWVVLDAIEDSPSTVAHIARRRGIARQAVQRVADLLEREGLAAYEPNPKHRRAKLLRPTAQGRKVLRVISIQQKAWADALGAEIGEAKLRTVTKAIEQVRRAVASKGLPGVKSQGGRGGTLPRWQPASE